MSNKISAEEALKKMWGVLSRLEISNSVMKSHQRRKVLLEEQTKLKVYAFRFDLIQNIKVREYLEKLKAQRTLITKDIAQAAVYLEMQEISEPYMEAHEEAKRAREEQDILQSILMEYQSRRKFRGIELENIGEQT